MFNKVAQRELIEPFVNFKMKIHFQMEKTSIGANRRLSLCT